MKNVQVLRSVPYSQGVMPSPRQMEVYRWIFHFYLKHGHAPSVREVGRGLDISSPNGVMCHINALCRHGLIEMSVTQEARSIRLRGVSWAPTFEDSEAGRMARHLLGETEE